MKKLLLMLVLSVSLLANYTVSDSNYIYQKTSKDVFVTMIYDDGFEFLYSNTDLYMDDNTPVIIFVDNVKLYGFSKKDSFIEFFDPSNKLVELCKKQNKAQIIILDTDGELIFDDYVTFTGYTKAFNSLVDDLYGF